MGIVITVWSCIGVGCAYEMTYSELDSATTPRFPSYFGNQSVILDSAMSTYLYAPSMMFYSLMLQIFNLPVVPVLRPSEEETGKINARLCVASTLGYCSALPRAAKY